MTAKEARERALELVEILRLRGEVTPRLRTELILTLKALARDGPPREPPAPHTRGGP